MVVAALFQYFAPSNRGFLRNKEVEKLPVESFYHSHDDDQSQKSTKNPQDSYYAVHSFRESFMRSTVSQRKQRRQSITTLRRKPLRAMAILTSVASDIDVISDWMFCYQTYSQDKKHRHSYDPETANDGELPYLVPPALLTSVFVFSVLGSLTYLVLATEGRIVAPLMQRWGVDKISMGFVLLVSVVLEDIPQVILTFLVEDYYEEGQFLSELAVCNLMASLYDTCIKLAESFDQRNDVVETGVWCKKSITGHAAAITAVLILPEGHIMPPPTTNRSVSEPALPSRSSFFGFNKVKSISPLNAVEKGVGGSTSLPNISNNGSIHRPSQRPLLVEAFFPERESLADRIHFLTCSMDRTIKLWDISSYTETTNTSSAISERQCVRVFQDIESKGITCMAWIGNSERSCRPEEEYEKLRCSFFLAGCNNGAVKLWDLNGTCHATYLKEEACSNRVASISTSVLDGSPSLLLFVCGHESGMIRIWNTWTRCMLAQFIAHDKRITSIRFMNCGEQFVSASTDSTLKLWNTSECCTKGTELSVICSKKNENEGSIHLGKKREAHSHSRSLLPDCRDKATLKLVGHRSAILSVAVVDDKTAILSGSRDGTARLWSIQSGRCLRIFRGHANSVTSVHAIDRVTFLTGSKDTTIKAWDALSGNCLRTYEGHTNVITGLSVISLSPDESEKATTFISASIDRTMKCWVLTSVSYSDPAATLDHILDLHENSCRCFDLRGSMDMNEHSSQAAQTAIAGHYRNDDSDSNNSYYLEAPS